MTPQELRDAIAYHREVHRPYLFAPRPGPIRECGLPSCRAVMAELAELSGRERWEAQEFERLAELAGSRYAEEWLSILREHCIPGHDAVPVWDALHLIMDVWRIAEADRSR